MYSQEIKPDPFANFEIPERWDSLSSFANWWLDNKMPIIFPKDPEVYLSDDATSICLFRKERFQVEMYLIHPQPLVPLHGHPGVQVIKCRMGKTLTPIFSPVLSRNQLHGSGMTLEADKLGFPLLALQYWENRDPTTIASMWKGKTVGPKHEALIRRFNPDCLIKNGYADVSIKEDGTPTSFFKS